MPLDVVHVLQFGLEESDIGKAVNQRKVLMNEPTYCVNLHHDRGPCHYRRRRCRILPRRRPPDVRARARSRLVDRPDAVPVVTELIGLPVRELEPVAPSLGKLSYPENLYLNLEEQQ